MAAVTPKAARSKCELEVDHVVEMFLRTVPDRFESEKWRSDDWSTVANHYGEFLRECIVKNVGRLNKGVIEKGVTSAFNEVTPETANKIAVSLKDTYSSLLRHARSCTTAAHYKDDETVQSLLKEAMKRRVSNGVASPSASPSPPASRGQASAASRILAMYGVTAPMASAPTAVIAVEEVLASQETIVASQECEAPAPSEEPKPLPKPLKDVRPARVFVSDLNTATVRVEEAGPGPQEGVRPARVFVPDLNTATVRVEEAGQPTIVLDMEVGPDGFVVCKDKNGVMFQTSVPNLLLQARGAMFKRPTANAAPRKKQKTKADKDDNDDNDDEDDADINAASSSAAPAAADLGGAAADLGGAVEREYRAEKYQTKYCYGIKQKFGAKQQVMSIGGVRYKGKITWAAMLKITKAAMKRMQAEGYTEADTAVWAKAQLPAL